MYRRSFRRSAARSIIVLAASLAGLVAAEGRASACACGCNIFDVGSSCLFPEGQGWKVYLEYDFQNQHENWSHSLPAPAFDNPDKNIRTSWLTLGAQYFITPDWGIQIEVPYEIRHFVTEGGATGTQITTNNWGDFGDIRVKGIFDGFFDDQSLGVVFGLKLPSGNYTYNDNFNDVDRDSEIGTGSVDVLLGGWFHQNLTDWCVAFIQGQLDAPVICRNAYYPGLEFDGAIGVLFPITVSEDVRVSPLGQVLESVRMHDAGQEASKPNASGFERVLVSLGFEIDVHAFSFYFDAEAPVYVDVRGNQLVAPVLFKAMVGWKF